MEEVVILKDQPICNESAIGCDIHSDNVVCCSLQKAADGTWIRTREVFDTNYQTLPKFTHWCQKFNPDAILMESTGTYWMSPYDALEAAHLPISVVNPAFVKGMAGHKTDQEDASWLAQIGVNGTYKPSYIPDKHYRDLKMVSRNITKLTNLVKSCKNRETKIFVNAGYRLSVFSDEFGKLAQLAKSAILEGKSAEEILELVLKDKASKRLKATKDELLQAFHGNLTPSLKLVIESNQRLRDSIEAEIKLNTEYLISEIEKSDGQAYFYLQTIPGIDKLSAATILVELGGAESFLSHFSSADKFSAWVGLCPGNNNSNNKMTGKKGRHGDKYLRGILCEAANAAVRTKETTFRSKYQSLVIRLRHKKSVVAIAHKIAKVIYYVLSHNAPYIDPRTDYRALSCKKNKARWIRQLLACKELSITVTDKNTGEVFNSETVQFFEKARRVAAAKEAVGQ